MALFTLILMQTACENAIETVESRDAEGRLEKYQRRKKDFAKEGLYQRFGPNGALLEEARFANDSLNGERKFFYPGGAPESIEHYRHGVIDGKYQKFYENGKLQIEQTFVNGAMQGLSIKYYANGAVEEKVTIRDNLENGPFTEYYDNGNLKAEGFYAPQEDGEPAEQGELKEYDQNGQLVRIAECAGGVCRTKWKKDEKSQ